MTRVLIISLIILLISSCNKDKELLDEIYNEPGYSIGLIKSKTSASTAGVSVITYHYEYYVDSKIYKGKKKGDVKIMNDGNPVGLQYLVVYKLSDPDKSDLNFRYLIRSEQDFIDLVEKF